MTRHKETIDSVSKIWKHNSNEVQVKSKTKVWFLHCLLNRFQFSPSLSTWESEFIILIGL